MLVWRMNSTARRVCVAAAGDYMANHDGAGRIVNSTRNHFAPVTADSIPEEAARLS